ncbi:MAG TPA: Rne/Rng family ribonuclease, partial [Paracoccus sp.]|nr:Rne/Rng family ribonuclease [Paracoccus sp. (in: a-proteobacteria)]
MGKKLLIDATHAEETRVVVVDGNKVEEFDFETIHKRQLAGNIYLAKVTRVEPSLQAAFVDYGGNRHGFLAFAEIHPDYYQIPVADRKALLEEERALAREQDDEGGRSRRSSRNGGRGDSRSGHVQETDAGNGNGDSPAGSKVDTEAANSTETAEVEAIGTEAIAEAAIAEPATAPEAEGTEQDAQDDAAQDAEEGSAEARGDTGRSDPDDTPRTIAAPVDSNDAVTSREISGMDIVDLDDEADESGGNLTDSAEPSADAEGAATPRPSTRGRTRRRGRSRASDETPESGNGSEDDNSGSNGGSDDNGDAPRFANATERDDEIESVADEDVSDEVRPRRPRARRYKIQEVVKVRQIMLVQVVKEERGNKGAALTTYLSLAGRYCVLMPNTARGGGISRKITQATDRKKLKEIAQEIEVPEGAGLIIRTAGANRTKAEIKRDYEYLSRLWEQIRELTLKSVAPAPIYEEGNLIKRSIRDLYSREIDEVLVEGEEGYRVAKDFMKMIMPSHARNVKQYIDQMPLFARFQVESYLGAMFNPAVQLKSGGYIVIGTTEALVAIDINSGKSTREGSIEETALKTNLEAADEIARQLRLRDLAGLIVIDFIDMEERKNNAAVEKRLKERLKNDRARIQVGRISGFGLLEMSRQRLRPGMLEATTQPCAHCHGTGLIRSDNSLALTILRALDEEGTRNRSREVLVKAPVGIVNYLFNSKREHLAQIELRYGMAIRLEADPAIISPDYLIEKFKTATRIVAPPPAAVVSFDAQTMSDLDDELGEVEVEDANGNQDDQAPGHGASAAGSDDGNGDGNGDGDGTRKKRRRRRRRRGGSDDAGENARAGNEGVGNEDDRNEGDEAATSGDAATPEAAETLSVTEPAVSAPVEAVAEGEGPEDQADAKPTRKGRTRRKPKAEADAVEAGTGEAGAGEAGAGEGDAPAAAAEPAPAPKRRRTRKT